MSHRPSPRSSVHTRTNARTPARAAALLLALGLSLALSLGTVLAGAAPAHAGKRTLVDERRDVLKQVGTREPRVAPGNRSADVVRFVTTMTRERLVLSTTTRDLPKNFWAMLWSVRTDVGTTYDVDLMRTGNVSFSLSAGGVDVPCEGVQRNVNANRAKVTVSLPLVCLGDPASVRTGAGAAATDRDFGRIFTDDAARSGAFRTQGLALGRTVKRG